MNNSRISFLGCALTLLSPVYCQSETSPDGPVVVISDVENSDPQVLAEAKLSSRQDLGASFQEALSTIVGAYSGNPTSGVLSLRGLNQDGLSPGIGAVTNPVVNVFENGVPLTTTTLRYLPPPSQGLDSLIVRKGAANDLPGPAALAGALFFENSTPLYTPKGKIVLEYAEDDTLSSYFTQSIPLLKDELSFRLSYYHFETDGQATAPTLEAAGNTDFSAFDRDRVEGALLWNLGGNQDQSLQLNLLYDQSGGNPQSNTAITGSIDLFDRISNVNIASSYPAERLSASLRGSFSLPHGIHLSTTTAFQTVELGQNLDFDGISELDWTINGITDETLFSQSVVFSGEQGAWDWQVGGFFEENSFDVSFSGIGIFPIPFGSPYDNVGNTEVNTLALYASLARDFSENFRASLGLRYQRDEREFEGASTFSFFPTIASSVDASDDVLLPSVKLQFFPSEESEISLSLTRGHRAGGISFAPVAGISTEFDSESSWDLELSARHRVNSEIALSGAIFYSQIDGQQVANNVPGGVSGIDLLISNAGESERYGAEIEATWKPLDSLSLYGSAALLKTEFNELTIDGVDRAGQAFPNAPEFSLAVGAQYHHSSGFFGIVNYSWTENTYALVGSPEATFLESRNLLNARLGWEGGNTKIYLFASNLLDDEYALYRGPTFPAPLIPQVGKAGTPRLFGGGVEYSW